MSGGPAYGPRFRAAKIADSKIDLLMNKALIYRRWVLGQAVSLLHAQKVPGYLLLLAVRRTLQEEGMIVWCF